MPEEEKFKMLWFWLFMLAMDLLIPLVMIGSGRMFLDRPPRTINSTFGYRTAMSMKNQDTWQFTHHYCGKLWFWTGMILLPLSIIPLLLVFGRDIDTIGMAGAAVCFAQVALLVGSIIPTERALKKTFDKNGKRSKT